MKKKQKQESAHDEEPEKETVRKARTTSKTKKSIASKSKTSPSTSKKLNEKELRIKSQARKIEELQERLRTLLESSEGSDSDETRFELGDSAEAETTTESLVCVTPPSKTSKNIAAEGKNVENFHTPSRRSPPRMYRRSPPGVTEVHPIRMAESLACKLSTYSGHSDIEEFIKKFEGCSEYYSWNERDRKFQLHQALEGQADRVVRDTCPGGSVNDVIATLRRHFGVSRNVELARVELRARQKRAGESFLSYYQDLCRLQRLVFGEETNSFIDAYMRDAFVYGLDNVTMRREILREKPVPSTMLLALNVAEHLEAIDSLDSKVNRGFDRENHDKKRGDRIKIIEDDDIPLKDLKDQLAEMRDAFDSVRCELKKRRTRSLSDSRRPKSVDEKESRTPRAPHNEDNLSLSPVATEVLKQDTIPSPAKRLSKSSHVKKTSESPKNQPRTPYLRRCFICNSSRHLQHHCPHKRNTKDDQVHRLPERVSPPIEAKVLPKTRKGRVYVTILAKTRHATALLDTGCAHSIVGRNVIPRTNLEPTNRKLYTASGASLPILGETTIHFQIAGVDHQARVAVTEAIREIILGIDWIENNVREWNFEKSKVNIKGVWAPLTDGYSVDKTYEIAIKDDVVMPA